MASTQDLGLNEPEIEQTHQLSTQTKKFEIRIAKTAGICFGVERALNLSEKAIKEKSGPLASLGPIIHNPQKVAELSERGMDVAEDLSSLSGTVVFRSHGVPIETQSLALARGLNIVDATCPLVKVPQNFARKLSQNGYFVVIVGDKAHPEIKGVMSYVQNGEVAVIKSEAEVQGLPEKEKVGIICQTTLNKSVFERVIEKCRARFKEVKVYNTICSATRDRQAAAAELAVEADCMIVIGGRNSSNTQKLLDICKDSLSRAFLVETQEEIRPEWLEGSKVVGITAGASTPHLLIEKIRGCLAQMGNA